MEKVFWGLTLFVFIGLVGGIVEYFSNRKKRKIEKRAHEEALRREADKAREIHVATQREFEQRMDQWVKCEQMTLYYNTIDGVMSVVTPETLQRIKAATLRAIRDGFWEHENSLMPADETFVFVNKKGIELLTRNSGQRGQLSSGFFSSLDDLVEKYDVNLVREPALFVPFVNEALLPFTEHKARPYWVERIHEPLLLDRIPVDVKNDLLKAAEKLVAKQF